MKRISNGIFEIDCITGSTAMVTRIIYFYEDEITELCIDTTDLPKLKEVLDKILND